MRKLSPKEVYEELSARGEYEEAYFDGVVVKQVLTMLKEDYAFARQIKQGKNPRWRVVFNAYYDILRELCDLLLLSKQQKSSNHQGVFAFIILNFPELEFDWELLEQVRKMRNESKYEGKDISVAMWKSIELHFELYISALKDALEKLLAEEGRGGRAEN